MDQPQRVTSHSGTVVDEHPTRHLLAADVRAAAAARRLRTLQARAFLNRGYDPDALDRAILAYRRAQAAADAARAAWVTARQHRHPDQAVA
jgi:hypothetical protein